MPYLTQLATVARRTGHQVTEVPGWKTRGHGPQPEVKGVVCHHTAGWDDMHVVRDGHSDLDGPLSHFWLRRDGRIYVIAAGRCWHNAPSTSPYHDNSSSVGIEAENDGRTPWPAVQLDAYKKLCAELSKEFDLPASRTVGHKEVNTSKIDPHSINMNGFRADVARLTKGEDDDMPDYVSAGVDGPQPLRPDTWTHINWDREYVDPNHQHANEGGWSLLWGPARYSLSVGLTIRGLPPGTEGQVRAVEADRDDAGNVQACPIGEFVASSGDTYVTYGLPADMIGEGRRLRVQVQQFSGVTAQIVAGSAKVLYWR